MRMVMCYRKYYSRNELGACLDHEEIIPLWCHVSVNNPDIHTFSMTSQAGLYPKKYSSLLMYSKEIIIMMLLNIYLIPKHLRNYKQSLHSIKNGNFYLGLCTCAEVAEKTETNQFLLLVFVHKKRFAIIWMICTRRGIQIQAWLLANPGEHPPPPPPLQELKFL